MSRPSLYNLAWLYNLFVVFNSASSWLEELLFDNKDPPIRSWPSYEVPALTYYVYFDCSLFYDYIKETFLDSKCWLIKLLFGATKIRATSWTSTEESREWVVLSLTLLLRKHFFRPLWKTFSLFLRVRRVMLLCNLGG